MWLLLPSGQKIHVLLKEFQNSAAFHVFVGTPQKIINNPKPKFQSIINPLYEIINIQLIDLTSTVPLLTFFFQFRIPFPALIHFFFITCEVEIKVSDHHMAVLRLMNYHSPVVSSVPLEQSLFARFRTSKFPSTDRRTISGPVGMLQVGSVNEMWVQFDITSVLITTT